MNQPLIFLSTCEFSGDMHGEVLINELRKILPDARFYGLGGERMASAGMEVLFDPTKRSTIGFVEVFKNLGKMTALIKEISGEWEKRPPEIMIWLDSGGFNLKLAAEAQKRGIPVVCMFSPSAWGYWEERAVKLAERVKLLLAVLPFEADFYRKFGTNVKYIGHPLIDRVGERDRGELRKRYGLMESQKLVALMPGSRRQEIARLLPVMLEAAQDLNRELEIKWVLPLAASIDRNWLESIAQEYQVPLEVITSNVYDLLAAVDGAVISSGTATLEAAILNTPMVVIYSVSKLSFFIYMRLRPKAQRGKRFLIALPNIIMGREIVPELVQQNLSRAKITEHLRRILTDPRYNAELQRELQEVKAKIGPPGVMRRAAAEIAGILRNG